MMSKATIVWVFAASLVACATGGPTAGGDQPIDAAVAPQDSSSVQPDDAAVAHDAPVSQDAQVSQLPDAGSGSGGGGLFCATNSDCTVSGECCVNLGGPGFCAAGTPIGSDICFRD
jgi:hypothetical protein